MEFKELKSFIGKVNQELIKRSEPSEEKTRILSRLAKLGEEYGELCGAVMAYYNEQRPEKIAKLEGDYLDEEIADVIVTTLLLALVMDVDIERALENKFKKIRSRFGMDKGVKMDG